jgi:hypothetical protein
MHPFVRALLFRGRVSTCGVVLSWGTTTIAERCRTTQLLVAIWPGCRSLAGRLALADRRLDGARFHGWSALCKADEHLLLARGGAARAEWVPVDPIDVGPIHGGLDLPQTPGQVPKAGRGCSRSAVMRGHARLSRTWTGASKRLPPKRAAVRRRERDVDSTLSGGLIDRLGHHQP